MRQQTAVEFIASKLRPLIDFNSVEQRKQLTIFIKQAKEIEKEQIMNAFNEGENNSVDYFNPENRIKESEQYYNETYGGNK